MTGDDPVRVHYTGVTWDDQTVFDTTWDDEPAVPHARIDACPASPRRSTVRPSAPRSWSSSRPTQGYGDQAQGPIPANSTLVFVIDILGLDQTAAP